MKKRVLSILLILCMMLCILPVTANAMSIYIKLNVTGADRLTLEVEPGDSIHNVKEKIEEKLRYAVHRQSLYYAGKELPNGDTLMDYNIQKESELTLEVAEPTTVVVKTQAELIAEFAKDTTDIIQLGGDIICDTTVTVSRLATLDLNGYVLQKTGDGSAFMVEKDGRMTVTDSNPAAVHNYTPDEIWKLDETGGTKALSGGAVVGGSGTSIEDPEWSGKSLTGGIVLVYGELTLEGGNLVGGSASYGGGIAVINGSLIMNGGSVTGCKESGVYVNGSFTMTGGTIADCKAYYGGGVNLNGKYGGEFVMSGGLISDCTAREKGGGVSCKGGGTFIMSGTAVIAGCFSDGAGGGGVRMETGASTFIMSGGKITGCTANKNGGGVVLYMGARMTMSGSAEISADCSDLGGNSMWLNGQFTADGGVVRGNVWVDRPVGHSSDATGYTAFYGEITGWTSGHPEYPLHLETNGGRAADTKYVKLNDTAVRPDDPVRTGYIFGGWYTDQNCTDGKEFQFDSTKIRQVYTLYAKWMRCDHSGNTNELFCTQETICSACKGKLASQGHKEKAGYQYDTHTHWIACSKCTDRIREAAHAAVDDNDCTTPVVCKCGYTITAAKQVHTYGAWSADGDGTHTRHCTMSGCTASETKECSGGTADCREQAACEVCGALYGQADPQNHSGKKKWEQTKKKHTQKYECCGAVVVPEEVHEWKNGTCKECGYKCAHSGGKATETRKAVCKICGKAYGKLKQKNNGNTNPVKTELPEVSDVPKTAEIPKTSAAPKTGDTGNPLMWFAVLFVSGGAVIVTTGLRRRKNG